MAQFKIISNPYEKQITYEIYDESENKWTDIVNDPNYKGKLKAAKLIHGFFPFVVNEVIDVIIDEFGDNKHSIQLSFEGTLDEYNSLSDICSKPEIENQIDLQPIGKRLNNAYEILPDIVRIFNKKVRPIVDKSITDDSEEKNGVAEDLKKFADASDDIIPICVIGNYSAGKSTFINALIGQEILPSGDKAVTARIFKIIQSPDNKAKITFDTEKGAAVLNVDDNSFELDINGSDNDVIEQLRKELSEIKKNGLSLRVNRALTIINDSKSEQENNDPLIEIQIPFNKGIWNKYPGRFVIFDTPGSNAASHADHKAVLTEAMKGMSNGIPVYVAERDSLDSTDNESLYDLVKQMEGLDPRFTMIVVNKADGANLPKDGFSNEQTEDILNESIPKNLYSSGIYFVSSIMGLGSKNDGSFIDEHCDETYHDNKDKYSDSDNKYYKQLYKYDIMPEQIKPYSMKLAKKEAEKDPVFANSGLYSIEHAVQTFASKYASYNKCQQSQLFLGKVIDVTGKELSNAVSEREETKKNMELKLEEDKKEMIAELEANAEEELDHYKDEYPDNMKKSISNAKQSFNTKDLKQLEDNFTKEEQEKLKLNDATANAKKESDDVSAAFKNGAKKLHDNFGLKAIKDVGSSIFKEAKEAIDSQKDLNETNREIDRRSAADLINHTNKSFYDQAEQADKNLAHEAQVYWTDCSLKFREKLAEVVKNTSLNDQKKNEITELIVSYKKIDFESISNEDIFKVDEFDYLLSLGNIKFFKMDKILLPRLSSAYRSRISEVVDKINQNVYSGYLDSFTAWKENLVNIVRTNIVDYSPELKEQQQRIDQETQKIHDLQNRLTHLQIYSDEIHSMIDWRED